MNTLVTGAAGFIGAHLCRALVKKGFQVWALDALLEESDLSNLSDLIGDDPLHSPLQFQKVDLRDPWTLRRYFSYFCVQPLDYVFHLAAQTHVDRSIQGDGAFWSCNVNATANLFSMLTETKQPVKMVLNQITDEVYGSIAIGHAQEGDKFAPTSPYACSKASQFYVGEAYRRTFGLPVASTFPSNTFGPGQWPEKLIPKFIMLLAHHLPVPLMKSTQNVRDWLAVEDHAEALIQVALHGSAGEHYNITANEPRTNLEVTLALLDLLHHDQSFIQLVEDRLAHDTRYAVSSCKMAALGWYPKESFEPYLQKTVEWYLAHQNRYTPWLRSNGLLPESSG